MAHSQKPSSSEKDQPSEPAQAFKSSDVMVFVEDAAVTEASIGHAQKVASAFGGKVALVQVLCRPGNGDGPIDPVEWDIKKQQTLRQLRLQTKGSEGAGQPCGVELLEGQCVNQIKAFMETRQSEIAASLRPHSDTGWYLSGTAWGVLLSQSAAVLMIPESTSVEPNVPYRRILVPLDGSTRGETALPVAITLARAENAELIICYVSPVSGLTEFGARDLETDRLHAIVRQRNEQAGKTYLARIRRRLEHSGLAISVRISHGEDVRRALIDLMSNEKVDFVVMATHGQSGHKDVPIGDVARFVLDKATVPVLLVRQRNGRNGNHAFGKVASTGIRQPTGTEG